MSNGDQTKPDTPSVQTTGPTAQDLPLRSVKPATGPGMEAVAYELLRELDWSHLESPARGIPLVCAAFAKVLDRCMGQPKPDPRDAHQTASEEMYDADSIAGALWAIAITTSDDVGRIKRYAQAMLDRHGPPNLRTANPSPGMIPGDKEEIADAREALRPILAKLGCTSMEDHGEDAPGDLYSDVECLRQLVGLRMADVSPTETPMFSAATVAEMCLRARDEGYAQGCSDVVTLCDECSRSFHDSTVWEDADYTEGYDYAARWRAAREGKRWTPQGLPPEQKFSALRSQVVLPAVAAESESNGTEKKP